MAPHGWLAGLFYFFINLGWFGLLLLGALDSSFLTLPLANDLAVIILCSLHHERIILYVAAATAGSLIGCAIMYWLGKKSEEKLIEAHVSPERFQRMRATVARRGPFMLALPGIIPPPFPFSPWVMAAGALKVPRNRFLIALAGFRALRFGAEGVLAIFVGRRVVAWLRTPWFEDLIKFLVVVAVAASAYSIYRLWRASRGAQSSSRSSKPRHAA